MTPGDSEITVERLQEIIELTLELEEEIPEEIGIVLIAFDPEAGDRQGGEIVAWLEETGFQQARSVALPTHLALVIGERPTTVLTS